jgi:hypothetical protein
MLPPNRTIPNLAANNELGLSFRKIVIFYFCPRQLGPFHVLDMLERALVTKTTPTLATEVPAGAAKVLLLPCRLFVAAPRLRRSLGSCCVPVLLPRLVAVLFATTYVNMCKI